MLILNLINIDEEFSSLMNNLTGEKVIEFCLFVWFIFRKKNVIYPLSFRLFVQEESSRSFLFTLFQLVLFFVFAH
jgi:hypothetical protein